MYACQGDLTKSAVIIGVFENLLTTISEAIIQLPAINGFSPEENSPPFAREWLYITQQSSGKSNGDDFWQSRHV